MPKETAVEQRHIMPHSASSKPPRVPPEYILSSEDKFVLYTVLQDIANEIRRIDHEHKKHNPKREPAH